MSEHPTGSEPNRPDAPNDPMDTTMSEHEGQRQGDTSLVGGDPTLAIPESAFRVEPATPVPDDVVVAEPAEPSTSSSPSAPSAPSAPDPATRQPDPEPHRPPLVTIQKGPRPGTVMLGLLALVVAGYVLLTNLTGAQVDLTRMGPAVVGGLGVLLLLVGVTGVLLGRRR